MVSKTLAPSSRIQIILVMGVTGVGKSTFIQYATGHLVEIGHGQESCTAKVNLYQIPDTNIYLMDTPGFDDTNISDAKILETITSALVDAFNDRAEIQGALYIHPVTEARMRGSGRKNLIMFKKVLGMKGMSHCRLVTTKWSLQANQTSIDRERELCEKEEFWKPLLDAGAQTVRFGDSMQSAVDIIRPLVSGEPFEPLLVEEVVKKKKPLSQTQAGRIVNDDIGEAKKAHQAEIAELRADEERARKAKDEQFAEVLQAERKAHEDKLRRLEDDKKVLETSMAQRKSGSLGRWIARAGAAFIGAAATIASGGSLAPAAALLYGLTETGAQLDARGK